MSNLNLKSITDIKFLQRQLIQMEKDLKKVRIEQAKIQSNINSDNKFLNILNNIEHDKRSRVDKDELIRDYPKEIENKKIKLKELEVTISIMINNIKLVEKRIGELQRLEQYKDLKN